MVAEQNNQAERAAFEAWHRSKFATRHSTGQPTRDMHNGIYDENYGAEHQQQMWEAWQAASRAALPAAVDAEGLLPLPKAEALGVDFGGGNFVYGYTATQVEQIRAEAIAADRRKQAALTQMIELGQEIEADLKQTWQPVVRAGQVKVGDKLRFKIGDKSYSERAKLILNAGTDKEEVIYNRRQNYYFITAMTLSGFSNHKQVEVFVAPSHQSPGKEG